MMLCIVISAQKYSTALNVSKLLFRFSGTTSYFFDNINNRFVFLVGTPNITFAYALVFLGY